MAKPLHYLNKFCINASTPNECQLVQGRCTDPACRGTIPDQIFTNTGKPVEDNRIQTYEFSCKTCGVKFEAKVREWLEPV